MLAELDASGFVVQRAALGEQARRALLDLVIDERVSPAVHHRSGMPFAARGLLHKIPRLRRELNACGLDALASLAIGASAQPIDAILLDKHARANWAVPGHQDRVMPARDGDSGVQRTRDGVAYSEPSAVDLSRMVALRVHFDDAEEATGALCFVPGTHRSGILSLAQIREIPLEQYRACPASAGDVLIMRPLTLHRSSPSTSDLPRRVLHVVYGPCGANGCEAQPETMRVVEKPGEH
jgi:phytanoyl-CoA dioxygenase PhyH